MHPGPSPPHPKPSSSPPPPPASSQPAGLLVVISGPSGVGKTTITRTMVQRFGAVFSISATTRPPAPAGVPDRDYRFVTEVEFRRLIDTGQLLEHAQVFGHFYGTPRQPVEDAMARGQVVVLEIDVQGALQVRRSLPEAMLIFIEPPDEAALLERLRRRRREPEDVIQKRFREARREIQTARTSAAYNLFIVNDNLDAAVGKVCAAVEARRQSRA